MSRKFRKLNRNGFQKFSKFIDEGRWNEKEKNGVQLAETPIELLNDPKTSLTTNFSIRVKPHKFKNKYEFGQYLCRELSGIPDVEIENDYLFWNSLSLFFFDAICFRTPDGERKVQAKEKWIVGGGTQFYYRHLVRTPWLFVKLYGETSKFLLLTRHKSEHLVSMVPETLEQFGSRGILLRNEKVINMFSEMYFDHQNQEPKPGLSGNDAGTPRRMGKVVRQLALTFDLESMSEEDLKSILPREFDHWRDDK